MYISNAYSVPHQVMGSLNYVVKDSCRTPTVYVTAPTSVSLYRPQLVYLRQRCPLLLASDLGKQSLHAAPVTDMPHTPFNDGLT